MADEIESKYKIVAGEAHKDLNELAKESDTLAKKADSAEKAVSKVGKSGGGHGGSEGEGGGKKSPGWMKGLSEVEQERFKEEKNEMLTRRARTRGMKLEMGKEQALHRLAETTLMTMVGEQNAAAQSIGKFSAMAQGMGASFAGFGGTMGKLGGVLGKVGMYGAIASVAVEAFSIGLEAYSATLNEKGKRELDDTLEKVKLFGKSMVMGSGPLDLDLAEKRAAANLGYRSVEDMKAAQETLAHGRKERHLGTVFQERAAKMKAAPEDELSADMAKYALTLNEQARRISSTENIPFDEALKGLTEATKHSTNTLLQKMEKEEHLKEVEYALAHKLGSMPAAEMRAAMLKNIDALIKHGDITAESREAVAEHAIEMYKDRDIAVATAEQREQALTAFEESAHAENQVERASEWAAKSMANFSVHANMTANEMAMLKQKVAEFWGKNVDAYALSPKQMQEVLEKTVSKKAEKLKHVTQFNNARFDIRQNFAEGYDPDRIALAFTQDLGRVADRQTMSNGHSPGTRQ